MLYATGLQPEDMNKPQVGVSSVWWEGNSCNMHLMDLAAKVKEGIQAEDMVGYRFNTIGVSDGISMGTPGMSFSLQSRDLIADSIETVMGGQWYDANVSLPGCDKNMPGCIIAMGRLNRPAIMIYGGTIKPGTSSQGEPLDIVSAFQSYGQYVTGAIDEESASTSSASPAPSRRLRRHVHGQHHGLRHRGPRHVPPLLVLHPRRGPPQDGRVLHGRQGDQAPPRD